MTDIRNLFEMVLVEIERTRKERGPFKSAHEGHSVIREEMEELWDHVKGNTAWTKDAQIEAVQLAAAAFSFMIDICPNDKPTIENSVVKLKDYKS